LGRTSEEANTGFQEKGCPMVKRLVPVILLVLIVIGCGICQATDAPMITAEQLSSLLGKADVVILDVRTPYDWLKSSSKIKGAVREDPIKFATWMGKYPREKTIVLYCS
jgi:predicted sulfurtransferase